MAAYISLPGTSGHYLSTADVNLLDADTAHATSRWPDGRAVPNCRVVTVSADDCDQLFGDQHCNVLLTGATITDSVDPTPLGTTAIRSPVRTAVHGQSSSCTDV